MHSTAVNKLRLVTSRCVGSGSALSMPQSALEAITSLDPKDYEYPKPSPAQQQAALAQFEACGTLSYSAGCYGPPEYAFNTSPFSFPSLKSSLPGAHTAMRSSQFDILPVADDSGIASILNLDLDPDCLKLLNAAASGDISEASTMTTGMSGDGGLSAELHRDPNSPSATSPAPQQLKNERCDEDEDEDEDELLVINAEGFTNVVELRDSNLLTSNMLRAFSPPASKNERELVDDHSSGSLGLKPLKLSLDYEAAALSMNAILAGDNSRKASEDKIRDEVALYRQGSFKRQRSE